MEIRVKKQVIATLSLTKPEIEWLRGISQNYLGNPDEENVNDAIIRERMFDCTTEFLNEWHK